MSNSPQPVRNRFVSDQHLPTIGIDIPAGQARFPVYSQQLSTMWV